jgi:GxxExxY protein
MLIYEELTSVILAGAIDVHKALGPGLLESVYEDCLCHEFKLRGIGNKRQVAIPIIYKGSRLDCGFRADLVVDEKVLIELKSVEAPAPIHEAQLLTYLRLSRRKVGFLINFNVPVLTSIFAGA